MVEKKFARLARKEVLTPEEIDQCTADSRKDGKFPEEMLLARGVPKHEILFSLSEFYNCPFVEYDEVLIAPYPAIMKLDLEKHRRSLWFPLTVDDETAEIAAYDPAAPGLRADIARTLGVKTIHFRVGLAADIIRIIENNLDVNPGFPAAGARTPLALDRVYFAYRRSAFAHYRTLFAKGRTGLAFIRTGISFIAISLTFLRIFGTGAWAVLEIPFLLAGVAMIVDGTKWYFHSRGMGRAPIDCTSTAPTNGTTLLTVNLENDHPVFHRTGVVKGAAALRAGWDLLSPVMRRRFLSCDRADYAEERTALAGYRTVLAKARTGLAFSRTGVAFAGMGIGLIRHFPRSGWTPFDLALIAIGISMSVEGFYWYLGGRRAGVESARAIRRLNRKGSIFDSIVPFRHRRPDTPPTKKGPLPIRPWHLPGIWATTGLALERTLLAERRSVMARVRTVLAKARTGLAFIRTGISIAAVGAGLLFFFGTSETGWTFLNISLIVIGLALIGDGFYWAVPAERSCAEYPYCHREMEIAVPDYGKPAGIWGKTVFDHEHE